MDTGQIFGRSLGFPPRVGADGRLAWSAGEENIRESIRVILLTNLRERLRLPEFGGGLPQYLFEPNTVATRHQIGERIKRARCVGAADRRRCRERRSGSAGCSGSYRNHYLQTDRYAKA